LAATVSYQVCDLASARGVRRTQEL